eukprot:tig00000194_g14761.t1
MPTCAGCEDAEAAVQCLQCEQAFCDDCNTVTHRGAKKAAHTRVPLVKQTVICDSCEEAPATLECSECSKRFCEVCDVALHRSAKKSSHSRHPLGPSKPAALSIPASRLHEGPLSPASDAGRSVVSSYSGAPPSKHHGEDALHSVPARSGSIAARHASPPRSVRSSRSIPQEDDEPLDEPLPRPRAVPHIGSHGPDGVLASIPGLYELMSVKFDAQDSSLVEKVIVTKSEVYRLCNDFAPGSSRERDAIVSFPTLNEAAVFPVGLYGNRGLILEYLARHANFPLDGRRILMDDPTRLNPGLYVWVGERESPHVFYWQAPNGFRDVNRKNVTCNFIRYMTELCDHTVCLLDSMEVDGVELGSRRERTIEEREIFGSVAFQLQTDDDVILYPGFQLPLPLALFADIQPVDVDEAFVRFAPGLTRRAIHTLGTVPAARQYNQRAQLKLSSVQFSDWAEKILATKNVEFEPSVSSDDIILFIQYAEPGLYAEWDDLQKNLALEHAEVQRQLDGGQLAQQLGFELEADVRRVRNAMAEHLRREFPEEEKLVEKTVDEEGVTEEQQRADYEYFKDKLDFAACSPKRDMDECLLRYRIGLFIWLEKRVPGTLSPEDINEGNVFIEKVMTKNSLKYWFTQFCSDEPSPATGRPSAVAGALAARGKRLSREALVAEVEKPAMTKKHPMTGRNASVRQRWLDKYKRERVRAMDLADEQARKGVLEPLEERIRRRTQQLRGQYGDRAQKLRSEFIANVKRRLSLVQDARFTVKIYSCTLAANAPRAEGQRGPDSTPEPAAPQSQQVAVTFAEEYMCEGRVARRFRLLDVLKEDIQKLEASPTKPIAPHLSDVRGSIELNPATQELKAAFMLKNNRALVFIQSAAEGQTAMCIESLGSRDPWGLSPLKVMKKPIDLLAFDESTRLLALYDASRARVDVYKFDDAYNRLEKTSDEVHLDIYAGESRLRDMFLVAGQSRIVFVDAAHRCRLYDIATRSMKPRTIDVGEPYDRSLISPDGSCLFLFFAQYPGASPSHPHVNSRLRLPETEGSGTPAGWSSRSVSSEVEGSSVPATVVGAAALGVGPSSSGSFRGGASEFGAEGPRGGIEARIYLLSTMKELKRLKLPDTFVPELAPTLEFVSFGPQMNLVAVDVRNREIVSQIVSITTQQNVCKVLTETKDDTPESLAAEKVPSTPGGGGETTDIVAPGAYLDYLYHVFDKFCIRSLLQEERRPFSLHVLLDVQPAAFARRQLRRLAADYTRDMMQRLQEETRKSVDDLRMTTNVWTFCDFSPRDFRWPLPRRLGDWIRDAICLVPIQIARAEGNSFKPLCDGLQTAVDFARQDVLAVAASIRFGLYEPVLESCSMPIRVVSSMGKQSTGKSYLLNHLTGSLFDISGGRCTDGVWLTCRPGKDCMYVVLDFEGLGSFERSEQEDMLLSVFNAAISNLTLYKTDFRIDKDTAATFARFQSGVSLIKGDDKLFTGRFYIVVKDVDARDVRDLQAEFLQKITHICKANDQENFISKMYRGQFAMSTFPPLGRREFYEHMRKVHGALIKQAPAFESGRTYKAALQLLMAKIGMKDWTPLDRSQIAVRVGRLRRLLDAAVSTGSVAEAEAGAEGAASVPAPVPRGTAVADADRFQCFDSGAFIDDGALALEEEGVAPAPSAPLPDTGLVLKRDEASVVELMAPLRRYFEENVERRGHSNFGDWHSRFQTFLAAVVARRRVRVLAWIEANVTAFSTDGDVQLLKHEASTALVELARMWTLCGIKCERCYYLCTLPKYHAADHSCLGTHKCEALCSYCAQDRETQEAADRDDEHAEDAEAGDGDRHHHLPQVRCGDLAGHAGHHDCRVGMHTCGEKCHLAHLNSCNRVCVGRPGHDGPHVCNAAKHLCGSACSLPGCTHPCVMPFEVPHQRHQCHESKCPHRCPMPGCNNVCASDDHFHGADSARNVVHLCSQAHPCADLCQHPGVCEIMSQLVRERRTFRGTRGDFEYDCYTEQNSIRRRCCKMIPPGATSHEGDHVHTEDPRALHYCDTKCPSCGYVCHLPWAHQQALHKTDHGNMRYCFFVAEDETIDIGNRKYVRGESGEAEMCGQYCRTLGRGHTHLVYCPYAAREQCVASVADGRRHETCRYGPDEDRPKDELTHAAYWRSLGFQDPCTAEEQEEFARCPFECGADEHQPRPGQAPSERPEPSYCAMKLWHDALDPKLPPPDGCGFVSSAGHHFLCTHTLTNAYHTYFVVDRSSSMSIMDCKPTMGLIKKKHDTRLGAVYESCHRYVMNRKAQAAVEDRVSMIVFNEKTNIVFANEPLSEQLVERMLNFGAVGNTNFSAGLKQAGELLAKYRSDKHRPLFIFLTDGTDGTGPDVVSPSLKVMEALLRRESAYEHRLVMHTIKFGSETEGNDVLEELAKMTGGTFSVSLDEVALQETFESISGTLRVPRGGLIRSRK